MKIFEKCIFYNKKGTNSIELIPFMLLASSASAKKAFKYFISCIVG
jgi:hypothetical protein